MHLIRFFSLLIATLIVSTSCVHTTQQDSAPAIEAKKRPLEPPALQKARKILAEYPMIDGHNDLPWTLRSRAHSDVTHWNLSKTAPTDTDIPRLRKGGVGGQFWSVYIPVGEKHKKQGYAKTQLEQIDLVHRMIKQYPDFQLALTSQDIRDAMDDGKIASLLGMEGGHAIENSIGALRNFYRLGVRYMTLTHYKNIDWADSATDKERLGGLSLFGRRVVREMNRLGMMVDLSHVSAKVMHQTLDISKAPVIFSHSSARALVDHNRNVPDDVLLRMRKNGGIVMVTFVTGFISQEVREYWRRDEFDKEPPSYLYQVADHIDHVAKVAGVDHVGIGGDFYDQKTLPLGLEDVSRYPYLFAELIRRGWSEEDLAKLAQKNILRVFEDVEKVAQNWPSTSTPMGKQLSKGQKASQIQ